MYFENGVGTMYTHSLCRVSSGIPGRVLNVSICEVHRKHNISTDRNPHIQYSVHPGGSGSPCF